MKSPSGRLSITILNVVLNIVSAVTSSLTIRTVKKEYQENQQCVSGDKPHYTL